MYDYIIVGAGSAGCVLANRLTADPTATVLLVEVGGSDASPHVRTPGLAALLWRTRHDWAFSTAPQTNLDGRQMYWPSGRILGGSSSINYMIYVRGHRDNYDGWRDLGNSGWGYEDVLPYFKRSENNARGADPFHGQGGPLDVTNSRGHAISDLLVEAAADTLGIRVNPDFNGAQQEGLGHYQSTIRRGTRCSTATAFLQPVRSRPNLTVETNALVTAIQLEKGRATGVSFRQGNMTRQVRAAREVILAAGAVGSAHLLLLSGIGPAEQLRQHDIAVAVDLPGVGKNLQDHLIVGVSWEEKGGLSARFDRLSLASAWARYALLKTGRLASNNAESGGFVRTTPNAPRPDLQLYFMPAASRLVNSDHKNFSFKGSSFFLGPTLLYPQSRGEIRLASADPTKPPIINPNYLSADADMRVLLDGVRLAQRIGRSRLLDGCRGEALTPLAQASDEGQLRAEIRRRCSSSFHPVGTCKMGSDDEAVVDAALRVRGVEGLRVADASVMPTIVGGNTNAPTIMIAEKAAELIRG